MISCVRLSVSISSCVCATISQDHPAEVVPGALDQFPAFHVGFTLPSHTTSRISPSAIDPSSLHISSESTTTIQFHTCESGQSPGGGLPQNLRAVAPIQIPTPTPRVRVGVAYIRIKF